MDTLGRLDFGNTANVSGDSVNVVNSDCVLALVSEVAETTARRKENRIKPEPDKCDVQDISV